MIQDVLILFSTAFSACVGWLDSIIAGLDAYWFLVSSIAVLLIVSLFIKPMRGGKFSFDSFLGSKGKKKG